MTLTASAAALATAFFSMAAVVRRQAEAVRAWNESRQGFTQLCEMDDRTLSDLGLARSDLRDATAAGYFGNPTTILAVRAKERRAHRQPCRQRKPYTRPGPRFHKPQRFLAVIDHRRTFHSFPWS